ncbi:MAG: hypothetical protein BAJATHORv1_40141 [Candidatus Thorarchaeota archaeon]|nr:MAG: hypothetical protein BAJATHORv1_40141 [Candidatus Thorarchaeota archaeon]
MLVNEYLGNSWNGEFGVPDLSWLSGAKAGMQTLSERSPTWLWDDFITDIQEMIELTRDLGCTFPGQIPRLGDGLSGSILSALGGYISITGCLIVEGLFFRVSRRYHEDVKIALSGIEIQSVYDGLVISASDFKRLHNLVTIWGPLEEMLAEEVIK